MRLPTASSTAERFLSGVLLGAFLMVTSGATPTYAAGQDVIRLVVESDGSVPPSAVLRTDLQTHLGLSVIGLVSELESTTEVLVTIVPNGPAFVVLREGTTRTDPVELERGESGWLLAGLVELLNARIQRRHQASLLMSWDQEQALVHQTGLLRWQDDRHNGLLTWDVPTTPAASPEGAEGLSTPPRP